MSVPGAYSNNYGDHEIRRKTNSSLSFLFLFFRRLLITIFLGVNNFLFITIFWVGVTLGGNFPGGNYLRWELSKLELPGCELSG